MHKFVRTPHLRGSRFQHGDHDMADVPWEELRGKHLIVEEKVDGANSGISFDEDGKLLLQSRGHYLRGGPREQHFDLLKQWASARQVELRDILGSRYVMYGEWLFAKHTCFYDALPHYFMEFDVLDLEQNVFLSTVARGKLLNHTREGYSTVCPVRVIAEGEFDKLSEVEDLLGRSAFYSPTHLDNLIEAAKAASVDPVEAMKHTDLNPDMEGLYIKWEDDGVVRGRYKYVRNTFTSSIMDQETHWHDRPIIQNKLVDGALEGMFG
jgi:RNA ligase-like protein